jgi:formylglycine-generating enzyme required for sulfatase activity
MERARTATESGDVAGLRAVGEEQVELTKTARELGELWSQMQEPQVAHKLPVSNYVEPRQALLMERARTATESGDVAGLRAVGEGQVALTKTAGELAELWSQLQVPQISYDPAVSKYVDPRRAELVERGRTAAESGDTVALSKVGEEQVALTKTAGELAKLWSQMQVPQVTHKLPVSNYVEPRQALLMERARTATESGDVAGLRAVGEEQVALTKTAGELAELWSRLSQSEIAADLAVAKYVEPGKSKRMEFARAAVDSGDVATMRSLAQAYTALVKDASAIRDVAPCVDASRFAPLVAAWQAALLADDATLADTAKREILALPRTGGVCAWSEVLVSAPNPSIITDSSIRERISATGLPWRVKDRTTGIEMVLIPAGKYRRGASAGDSDAYVDERPSHDVVITKAFYMGVYEVAQGEWQKLMGNNPSRFQGDLLPVEKVSWEETQEFLRQSNGLRLPTEGEWEYACRGGTTSSRYGELAAIAWYERNSGDRTHAVGGKLANGYGLHDMLGNVNEWCSDWYGSYDSSEQRDPLGPSSGQYRVCRGGSWNLFVRHCRASNRNSNPPANRYYNLGFRVARTP